MKSRFPEVVRFLSISAGTARVLRLVPLLLALPVTLQAQFAYVTNNGTITVTGYTGSTNAVVIPDTITGLPVTAIGAYAFNSRTNLVSVKIPSSVTSIGDSAFNQCSLLSDLSIPNGVTNIGPAAFANCDRLPSVTIPEGVTGIEPYTFYECDSLPTVRLPKSLATIGVSAFLFCDSLASVIIPRAVTNISDGAFAWCPKLMAVYFEGKAPSIGSLAFNGDTNTVIYYLPGTPSWDSTFGGRPAAPWLPEIATSDSSFGVRSNRFGFNIKWASGELLFVLAYTDLNRPEWWQIVSTNYLPDGGSLYFSDPWWTNYPARFYRLLW